MNDSILQTWLVTIFSALFWYFFILLLNPLAWIPYVGTVLKVFFGFIVIAMILHSCVQTYQILFDSNEQR
jgi:hypothetical protein